MAKTIQYLKRIQRSHATNHEICPIDKCEVARKLAEAVELPDDPDAPEAKWLSDLRYSVERKLESV